MSYLRNFREQLAELIEREQYKEAIDFAAEECRQGYYRGVEDGKTPKKSFAPKRKTRLR